MGLSIQVGGIDDDELYASLPMALVEAGLPAHDEPAYDEADDIYSCQMWGYSGLHALRRLAAYIALDKPTPAPADTDAAHDPLLEQYYDMLAPGFEHLLLHSDAEGFYLPQRFDDVIFPRDALNVPGGMIGSAPKLLDECLRLAQWLELPLDLDAESDEVWEAAESPATDGPKWQRFGKESFSCLRLIGACEASVASGRAIVFC